MSRSAQRPSDLRGLPKALLLIATAMLLLLVTLPLLAIAVRGVPTFADAVQAQEVGQAVRLTLSTSLLALLLIVLFGTPAAWLIARRQVPGWRVIDAISGHCSHMARSLKSLNQPELMAGCRSSDDIDLFYLLG